MLIKTLSPLCRAAGSIMFWPVHKAVELALTLVMMSLDAFAGPDSGLELQGHDQWDG